MKQWVELAIFYTHVERVPEDPPQVNGRAIVLYGEGLLVNEQPPGRSVCSENLGNGVHVLRVVGSTGLIFEQLTKAYFDYRRDEHGELLQRFVFDLVRRPLTLGFPREASGVLVSASERLGRVHQFVRTDKASLLATVAGQPTVDASSRERVSGLLQRLDDLLARQFRGRDARFLGDVLVVDHVVERAPVTWRPVYSANSREGCRAVQVVVDPEVASGSLSINARAFGTDGMVVADRLFEWRPGDNTAFLLDVRQGVRSAHVRAWSSGDLVVDEHTNVFASIEAKIFTAGETIQLFDRLTTRLNKMAGVTDDRISEVARVHKRGMLTVMRTGPQPEPWEAGASAQMALFDHARSAPPEHAYFPVGAEGRARAIVAFARRISEAQNVWLADPWFDAIGAAALLPRIVSNDTRLTVLTSLPGDDGGRACEDLLQFLREARAISLPANLTIYRVTRASGTQQAFHDRFLVTMQPGGVPTGYILTNSFSGMAANFPLVVVETPQALTSVLLSDLDSMLAPQAHLIVERLWPEIRARAAPMLDTGFFPQWRWVLNRCAPRSGRDERSWLAAAAAAGFLHLDAEGHPKWLMRPERKRKILDRLLGPPRVLRAGRALRRRAAPGRTHPSDIGRSVFAIGELAARGLDVTNEEVAKRVVGSASLVRDLRSSNILVPDPIRSHRETSVREMQLRQLMLAAPSTCNAAATGFSLWQRPFLNLPSQPGNWGRSFAYAVLCVLAPTAAVRLAEDLLDPALLNGTVDRLHGCLHSWPQSLSEALLRAQSPVLRALGAQALAGAERDDTSFADAAPPRDPKTFFAHLRGLGVLGTDLAIYAAVWGADRRVNGRVAELAAVLVDLLCSDGVDALREAVDHVVKSSVIFAEHIVVELKVSTSDRVCDVLAAMLDVFGRRLRMPETGSTTDLFFHAAHDLHPTVVVAQATAELARRTRVLPAHLIDEACQRSVHERELRPLSPFRLRPLAAFADIALGWSILLELLTLAEDPAAKGRNDAVARALDYLSKPEAGISTELRETIRQRIGRLREEVSASD